MSNARPRKKIPVQTVAAAAPHAGRPAWAYAALAFWLAVATAAAAFAFEVAKGKMAQRLKAEVDRGFVYAGDKPGQIGPSLAALRLADGTLLHLSDGSPRRLSAFGPGGKLIVERAATAGLVPAGLAQTQGRLWVALDDGRVAPLSADLRIGAPIASPVKSWRRFSALEDGRLAGIDGTNAVVVFSPGGASEQPLEGILSVPLALEGGPGGLAVAGQNRAKEVVIILIAPDGRRRQIHVGLQPSPYTCVAWAGPRTLLVNDTAGPKGLLAFDAESGRFLGAAQQSRQNDHLFNLAFVAGDPARQGFILRPALGLTWGRLPLAPPGLWILRDREAR